jgi:hypothetical protein
MLTGREGKILTGKGNTCYWVIITFFPKSLSVHQKKEENKKEKKAGFIYNEHLFLVRFTMIKKYVPDNALEHILPYHAGGILQNHMGKYGSIRFCRKM